MGLEIERKFLVNGDAWRRPAEGIPCRQGYLSSRPERVVRVRVLGARGFLTIKGLADGPARPEFEYPIPVADAERLLALCEPSLVEKTRTRIPLDGLIWEVDEFHGENAGLILAECELVSADQAIARPDWLGEEVTGDPRYCNSNLAAHPFSRW